METTFLEEIVYATTYSAVTYSSFYGSSSSVGTDGSSSSGYTQYIVHSIHNEHGQYEYVEGNTDGVIQYTKISDFLPDLATSFFDGTTESIETYYNGLSRNIVGDPYLTGETYLNLGETLFSGQSSEKVLTYSTTLQTRFLTTDFSEAKVLSGVKFISSASGNTVLEGSFSTYYTQDTSYLQSNEGEDVYYQTIISKEEDPIQIWYFEAPAGLAVNMLATSYGLINDIGVSVSDYLELPYLNITHGFSPVSSSAEDETSSFVTGFPQQTVSYTSSQLASYSTDYRMRNGDTSSTALYSVATVSSTQTKNTQGTFTTAINPVASYYEDMSVNTQFGGFGANIILNGTSIEVAYNFPKTTLDAFIYPILIGAPETYSTSSFSSTSSHSTSNFAGTTQHFASTNNSLLIPDFTVRRHLYNSFITTSESTPLVFDVSFNRGFCAFTSTNSSIYKHLLVSKKHGDGDSIISNSKASINPFYETYASNSSFTSFLSDACLTYTDSIAHDVFNSTIKTINAGLLGSTFASTTGGSFYTASSGGIYNVGGTVTTTISVSSNDTLASFFTYSTSSGQIYTQILELKLSDTIERAYWTQINLSSGYHQFNTNGSFILYPGAYYGLTINGVEDSYLLGPEASPKIIDFNKWDGVAITVASIFAKGIAQFVGSSYKVYPYVYTDGAD